MTPLLICLCGRVGSGKTTVAKDLSQRYQAVVFNADQWMMELFGDNMARDLHEEKLKKCKVIIYSLAKEFLERNISVLLDFGFWTRQEREDIRHLFKEYTIKMVYLKITEESQFERVLQRNQSLDKTYTIPSDMLKELNALFEEPDRSKEDFEIFSPI